ncbi:MAG: hypothetical protein M1826_006685 [Phylliscum demangeonii]|nr:MAG: hypothetical protein M1826_006685 [Phylliscum demangeonii]
MSSETLESEKKKREEAERSCDEEKKKREEVERFRDEKKKKLEEAERNVAVLKKASRRLNLPEVLLLWHTLYSRPTVQRPYEQVKTIKSQTTSAAGRHYPKFLEPWADFRVRQKAAYDDVVKRVAAADSNTWLPETVWREQSKPFLPIVLRNERDLGFYQHWAVVALVRDVWSRSVHLGGLDFDIRTQDALDYLADRASQLLPGHQAEAGAAALHGPSPHAAAVASAATAPARPSTGLPSTPPCRRTLNAVCSVTLPGERGKRKLFAVEYQAAHVLTPFLLEQGLRQLDLKAILNRTKIRKDEAKKATERAEEEVAKIATQVYDYMIDQGVTYAYATGGKTFAFFMFKPEDVHTMYFDYVTPSAMEPATEADMSQSAIGLVSFARLAMEGVQFDSAWIKSTRKRLRFWSRSDAEITEALTPSPKSKGQTDQTDQTDQTVESSPTYKGLAEPSNDGSHRVTRSKARRLMEAENAAATATPRRAGTKEVLETTPITMTTTMIRTPTVAAPTIGASGAASGTTTTTTTAPQGPSQSDDPRRQRLHRAYCTQRCLLGLVRGLALDARCPNVDAHRPVSKRGRVHGRRRQDQHHALDRSGLLAQLSQQMTEQAQVDYDIAEEEEGFCWFDVAGCSGALFRISLRSHGYTFVGKGTARPLIPELRYEARVYEGHLGHLQGVAVPVYVGSIDLAPPYWLRCSLPIEHLLCISWGGEALSACGDGLDPTTLNRETARTVRDVRAAGVDQHDLHHSNLLWNAELQRVLLIDFAFAKLVGAPAAVEEAEGVEGPRTVPQRQVGVEKATPALRER